MLGIPLIVSERSSEQGYARHWKTTLRVQIGRRARCIVANSEGGADYWRSNLPRGRVHVVRNCLQPSAHPAAVEREPVTPSIDDVLVLFAGRFSYEKNIAVLVESLLLVVRQHPTAHVLMFGDGPERDAVAQLVDREGMQERIKLKGYARDLFSWMKRAAVCISVSRFEGHPNVPIEAAHAGCPLVLSDIPSHREVFGDDSALIVSKDSPGQIADSVLDVLSNVSAARRRASRARLAVAALDITTAITAYLAVYNSVIADATRSAPRG